MSLIPQISLWLVLALPALPVLGSTDPPPLGMAYPVYVPANLCADLRKLSQNDFRRDYCHDTGYAANQAMILQFPHARLRAIAEATRNNFSGNLYKAAKNHGFSAAESLVYASVMPLLLKDTRQSQPSEQLFDSPRNAEPGKTTSAPSRERSPLGQYPLFDSEQVTVEPFFHFRTRLPPEFMTPDNEKSLAPHYDSGLRIRIKLPY